MKRKYLNKEKVASYLYVHWLAMIYNTSKKSIKCILTRRKLECLDYPRIY